MALEIKELHLNLHLGKSATASGNSGQNREENNTLPDLEILTEDIVKQVLKLLKEREER